ncbi:pseudouridine-5'-phosphate glycosidase [Pseudogemmatithrix spongiicola]|uniref:Pseudouridine-5'-phosphate glycosidase n=1 Tax=Pseudogemmatithrix spongiicola TaxID=3062599 RepID=A0AA49JW40_9BACT|nr:pseudouridine-5'-phosphate glycosidase [Gemmatimonadaceae bacterium 'strain 138']WKW16010.1 pseudouridine-5'-phosphate glycosidase [Gemmatimonadaceae bacterium 'strain 318']
MSASRAVRVSEEVAASRTARRGIVALESSVLAQGLPIPQNAEAARRMDAAVRAAGATPAVTAVVRGELTLGLADNDLARFLAREGIEKVSARDLGVACALGADGATTVAASLAICRLTGVQVFATGGIGGVHREPAFDESADLLELSRTPAIVVCAGAKSILDLPATLERLESYGVPVIGYRGHEFPGFFTAETGLRVPAAAHTPEAIAKMAQAHWHTAGQSSALLVVQPPPAEFALASAEVDALVLAAVEEARQRGIRGAALTPHLLAAIATATGGRSMTANLALLEANAALAGAIAQALAA